MEDKTWSSILLHTSRIWEFIQELILINTEKNPNLEQVLIA